MAGRQSCGDDHRHHDGAALAGDAHARHSRSLANDGPDIRSLAGEGGTLVYDRLGDIYLFDTATGTSQVVPIDIDADMPEVRPKIESVGDQIEHVSISPTGLRGRMTYTAPPLAVKNASTRALPAGGESTSAEIGYSST